MENRRGHLWARKSIITNYDFSNHRGKLALLLPNFSSLAEMTLRMQMQCPVQNKLDYYLRSPKKNPISGRAGSKKSCLCIWLQFFLQILISCFLKRNVHVSGNVLSVTWRMSNFDAEYLRPKWATVRVCSVLLLATFRKSGKFNFARLEALCKLGQRTQ